MSCCMEYLFSYLGSPVPAVSPPNLLHRPSSLAGGQREKEDLGAVQALLENSQNAGVSTMF